MKNRALLKQDLLAVWREYKSSAPLEVSLRGARSWGTNGLVYEQQ